MPTSTGIESLKLFKNGDVLTIVLPEENDFDGFLGCSLEIPSTGFNISYNSNNPFPLTGIEYLPDYYSNSKSCTIRVNPKILSKLEAKKDQKFLGKYWRIVVTYGVISFFHRKDQVSIKPIENHYNFFMNTLAWLEKNKYTVLTVKKRILLNEYSDIEYL